MDYSKNEVLKGVKWSAIEKITIVLIQLLLELLLARNLFPEDYGIMGIVMIFISLGTLFAEGGFSNALIHNLKRDNADFSTAFYFNIIVSLIFVTIIIICAPFLSDYFNIPVLKDVLRVSSISIVLGASTMIYKTKLNIKLDFRTQTKVSFISLIISGLIGLYLAINGWGVWSLVIQGITLNLFSLILLMNFVKWYPEFLFSKPSFNKMMKFGSNILLAGILQNIYTSLYNLFIGKNYSSNVLGLYSKSNQFTLMPAAMISGVLQRVMFPYFASFQENNNKISEINKVFTRIVCLGIFPIFIYLIVFAKPLVYYGLSSNWVNIVPLIQILSLAYMIQPIIVNNMVLFQVKNKTNLYFWIELITKIIGLIILFITLNKGIIVICFGIVIQLILQILITGIVVNFQLRESVFSQIKLLLPYYIYAVSIGLGVYFVSRRFTSDNFTYLVLGSAIFIILYILTYIIFEKNNILRIKSDLKMK